MKRNGEICHETKSGGHKVFEPFDPQPDSNDVLELHRNYNSLAVDPTYKRRITWIEPSTGGVIYNSGGSSYTGFRLMESNSATLYYTNFKLYGFK